MEPEVTTDEESVFSKIRSNVIELIEFVAITGAIVVIVHFFIAEPHEVSGSSMVPNFHDQDYLITNKIGTRFSPPQKGEVLILHSPRNPDIILIKRVVGLPRERIKLSGGKVYINGQLDTEPYLDPSLTTAGGSFLPEDEEITIPDGQYFVMGDNRSASSDSREFGTVKLDEIIGQAWFRYWPPDRVRLIQIGQSS
ncbi:signal peptidase I [Candidatus Daviesbacteria bacterium]|nr:signal peptidase I [Candidatus Daviesbacteria bacterium]